MATIYQENPFIKTSGEHFADLTQDTTKQRQVETEGGTIPADTPPDTRWDNPPDTQGITGGSTEGMQALSYGGPTGPYTSNAKIDNIYARSFQPISEGIGQGYGALGQSREAFRTGAEASGRNVYNEDVLRAGILPGSAADAQELEDARKLVDAAYTGPKSLELGNIDIGLREHVGGLRSREGIQGILGESVPGLTPGQRREEARNLSRQEGFQEARRGIERDLGGLVASRGQATDEAAQYAAGRQAEEEAVRNQSRGFIEGQRGSIMGDIGNVVSSRNAEAERMQNAWRAFQDTGELERLLGVPAEAATVEDGKLVGQGNLQSQNVARNLARPGNLTIQNLISETPEIGRLREAEKARAEIQSRYQDLAEMGVPELTLGVSSHGREKMMFPDEWFAANRNRADFQQIKERAIARQQELEKLFAPGTGNRGGNNLNFDAKYSDVDPLYFGNKFEPEDLRNKQYSSFVPGNIADIGNSSTKDQQATLQNIENLMGRLELTFSQDPYQASKILINVKNFLDSEHEKLATQKKGLSENQQAWKQAVKHARDKYKQRKYNLAGRIVIGGALGPFWGSIYEGAGHDKPIYSGGDSSSGSDKSLGRILGNIFGDYGK